MKNSNNGWQSVKNADQMVGMLNDFLELLHERLYNVRCASAAEMETLYWIQEDIKHVKDEVNQFRLRNTSD